MAKLGDFKTPTGASGNIFSLSSWMELVIGAAVMFLAIATGQRLVQKIPNNPILDKQIEPIVTQVEAGRSYLNF